MKAVNSTSPHYCTPTTVRRVPALEEKPHHFPNSPTFSLFLYIPLFLLFLFKTYLESIHIHNGFPRKRFAARHFPFHLRVRR